MAGSTQRQTATFLHQRKPRSLDRLNSNPHDPPCQTQTGNAAPGLPGQECWGMSTFSEADEMVKQEKKKRLLFGERMCLVCRFPRCRSVVVLLFFFISPVLSSFLSPSAIPPFSSSQCPFPSPHISLNLLLHPFHHSPLSFFFLLLPSFINTLLPLEGGSH